MSNFTKEDIVNSVGIVETGEDVNRQVLHTMRISSDEAYERLKIVRETYKDLDIELNQLTRDMPYNARVEYEHLFILLEKLEKIELENIRFGE